ncbi:hypothetical protein EG328_004254 [Venturia inaequalis]|uniref:Major facilitator superfamily (MFS) profile domain-containing protein n=1 Tax=Venturia inaequalis TaxID=5025 RepID=A0A8H3ZF42_VENIN|nr:hypothetical protein EG328_004254 [Venturia inaequalis]KAE9989861.1 hypothetical protein EG327_002163 [Venturia inaequalis]
MSADIEKSITTEPPEKAPQIKDEETRNTKMIETVHNDEAVKVLANYHGEEIWEDAEEKRLRRKLDWKLMPILCLTYGLQYYDKSMLSQAALFGLRQDLGLLKGTRYSYTAAIFYLGYILGTYPIMILAQRFPIERVASVTVTLWGICLILTTVCTNYKGIYAQRFFLGALESGINPMFMMIVASFYRKNEQAIRMGIWYSCTGYVSIVSPLINYGFGSLHGGKGTWRYMFYFAGSLTIVWGIAIFFLLPPDPVRAKGFNDRERYIMIARLRPNNAGVRNTHFKAKQAWELFLDLKFWLMFIIALLCQVTNGPISAFIPIIVKGFGFTSLNSILLIMPAGAYSGTLQLILTFLAGKYTNIRSYLVFGSFMGTIFSAVLLWKLPLKDLGGLLFAIIILPSFGAGYAVMMGLQVANIAGYTKKSLASSGLYIGYCLGNFAGPLVFKSKDAPRYVPGFTVVVICVVVAAILILAYAALCKYDNQQRDKTGIPEGFDHAYEDDLTDKTNPQFRYII